MIVSNINNNNHFSKIKEFAVCSDELLIVSPFLFNDFEEILEEIITTKTRMLTLVTTMKANVQDLVNKSASFISFVECLERKNVEWSIHINNRLHGKIYIFKNNGEFLNCIITSANFTNNGMIYNHEWGTVLTDKQEIIDIYKQIQSSIQFKNLNIDQIIGLMLEADKYNEEIIKQNEVKNKYNDNIRKILKEKAKMVFDKEVKYFIKPVGSSDDKVWEGDFTTETEMYFSRRRPNSVNIDDILIAYAVGPTSIISIFQVTSEPINTGNANDRWPWYVEVENITPNYGSKWNHIDLKINDLVQKYLETHTNGKITGVGGDTLGALNFGADKIHLNLSFAEFIVNIIEKKENAI